MPQFDEPPIDPRILAELDAIDATLRDEAVDPAHAEIAEVALLLVAERPAPPRSEFSLALDARVERHFRPEPAAAHQATRPKFGQFFTSPGFKGGLAAVLAVAVLAAIIVVGSSGGFGGGSSSSSSSGAISGGSSSSGSAGVASSSGAGAPSAARPPEKSSSGSAATLGSSNYGSSTSGSAAALPAQNTSGRKVVQSTQIELTTSNRRIDAVSQEVFNLVSLENGIVERSQVSSASMNETDSYASFTLSIPTGNLETAMNRLSRLRYARVVSRRQESHDVTDTYRDDKRELADAQALRTSLLKQLQVAPTDTAVDSLKAQIQTAERRIRSYEQSINKIQHSVSYTTVKVQINAQNIGRTPPAHKSHSSFTIGSAGHDALRVLVVAAGVILIGLAALIPLGLIAALLLWIAYWARQRSREHALDQP